MLAMNIPDALEAKLKRAARQRGKKPADMVIEALEHWLETEEWRPACRASSHEPNEETIAAIEESNESSGAKTYTTAAELFEDLDKVC